MNGADYLFAFVIIASLVVGVLRGFIRELISLLSWVIGLWLAWHFSYLVHPWLGGALAEPGIREWAGRIIVLFLVLLAGNVAGYVFNHFAHRFHSFGSTDRLLGGLFGLLRAFVLIGLFVIAGRSLGLQDQDWWVRSQSMPMADTVANLLEAYAEPAASELLEKAAERPGR